MSSMMLKIVTPDRLAFSGEAERVMVRTLNGDVMILPRHAEFSAALSIGKAKITANGITRTAAVNGGVITVVGNEVTIMAITFEWADEIDAERAKRATEKANEQLKGMSSHDKDYALAEARLKRSLARVDASKN